MSPSFPFDETLLGGGSRIRTFSSTTDIEELVWHRDVEDRNVRVIVSEGWYIQFDDEIPTEMHAGDTFLIPGKRWHRVLRKGSGQLVVEISDLPSSAS